MEKSKEALEANLNRIRAIADALSAATLGNNKALEPDSVKELAYMIKDLADESLVALDGPQTH